MEAYDAVVRNWPVAPEELDIPTRLGPTHVIASGARDAPALLLLSSLAASAAIWQPNVEALSAHFRTYAVDTIGQVGKSVPTRRFRGRRDLAAWLNDLLDGLGAGRASLVGNSYGGFVALNQASLAKDRVKRVVLISPAGSFVGLSWQFYYTMLVKGPLRRLIRGRRREDVRRLPGGMKLDHKDGGWGALMATTMMESGRPDTVSPIVFRKSELHRIKAPTLLLIGEKEVLYDPEKTLKRAMTRMPGLSGEIVPGAHHLAAQSSPEAVNKLILQFLLRPS
jgi:pimeloyl-ACP methyl ester carboxylesterase